MALNHHLVGNSVALIGSCAVVDLLTKEQTDTDPTTLSFIRRDAAGVETTYTFPASPEVTKLAAGIYACVVTVIVAGRETWRFETTGACESAAEHEFVVDASSLS